MLPQVHECEYSQHRLRLGILGAGCFANPQGRHILDFLEQGKSPSQGEAVDKSEFQPLPSGLVLPPIATVHSLKEDLETLEIRGCDYERDSLTS